MNRFSVILLSLILPFTLLWTIPTRVQAADDPFAAQEVSVLFATNRGKTGDEDLEDIYGNELDQLSFGSCSIRFSPVKLLKDAAEHIPIRFPTERESIVGLQNLPEKEFWSRIEHEAKTGQRKIVFYIHGYKMSFEKSCRRTALLQRELGEDVIFLLFAWPSQDNFALYTQDETLLRKSSDDIRTTLSQMLQTVGPVQSNVLGHSLGTRGVTSAIVDLGEGNQSLFDELVLVAPDMDRLQFERSLPQLAAAASGITVYVSENDSPLKVSRGVHGEPRIGEAGEHLTIFAGVETIDISDVPQRDIYGHNYHYFNSLVIDDLRQLLIEGKRANARTGLEQAASDDQRYWRMVVPM